MVGAVGKSQTGAVGAWITISAGVVVAADAAYALAGIGASHFPISGNVTGFLGGMSIDGGFDCGKSPGFVILGRLNCRLNDGRPDLRGQLAALLFAMAG
jgi:hypothetical protein